MMRADHRQGGGVGGCSSGVVCETCIVCSDFSEGMRTHTLFEYPLGTPFEHKLIKEGKKRTLFTPGANGEACEDGRSGERVRAGGRAGRRLLTAVIPGWGRASRSTRTEYHTCQQFAVEFGRVTVNTDDLLGEAYPDSRLFAGHKTIPEWSIQIVVKCTLYIRNIGIDGVEHRPP